MYGIGRRPLTTSTSDAIVLFAAGSRADNWDGWGTGPVVGYALGRGFSLGWELSGGTRHPAVRGATGVFYRPDGETARELGAYVAYEPWLAFGGTLGLALSNEGGMGMYGAWEGLGFPRGYRYEQDHPQQLVTLTVGWRVIGTTHEFYFTPKYAVYEAYF
jgi:hypothetical protein